MNLTADLVSHLFEYGVRDYRRFLSAHLQFLNGLCALSIQSVNGSIHQFLSSLLITTELQPPTEFKEHIRIRLGQSKSVAPATIARLVTSISAINHGNTIISTYGTNFKCYFPHWFNESIDGKFTLVENLTAKVSCEN